MWGNYANYCATKHGWGAWNCEAVEGKYKYKAWMQGGVDHLLSSCSGVLSRCENYLCLDEYLAIPALANGEGNCMDANSMPCCQVGGYCFLIRNNSSCSGWGATFLPEHIQRAEWKCP